MFSLKEKKIIAKKFVPPVLDCKSSEYPMHVSTAFKERCRLLPGTNTQANKCSDKLRGESRRTKLVYEAHSRRH